MIEELLARGDVDGARLCLERAINDDPEDVAARRMLAKVELSVGNVATARLHFSIIHDLDPDQEDLAFEIGVAALAAGEWAEAARWFECQLAVRPNHPGALYNHAFALRRLGRDGEAATSLLLLLSVAPDNTDAWFNLGNALIAQYRPEEAVPAFQRAAGMAPQRLDIRLNLAIALRAIDQPAEALALFRSILDQDPANFQAVNGYSATLIDLGRAGEAEPLLRRALEDGNRQAAPVLASALKSLGRYQEAEDHARRAVMDSPHDAGKWQILAQIEATQGKLDKAEETLRRAAELDPRVTLGDDGIPPTALWHLHPRGDFFLARGGMEIPPPRTVSLALTNKCNLRCDICGSQGTLDATGTRRIHMPLATFDAVAETLFPQAVTVELNSRGDPLLYPHIVEVLNALKRHNCHLKLQTNGTLFTPEILDRILDLRATINVSIDAVGTLFDQVRTNGKWELADPRLRELAKRKDPKKHDLQLYPTVTARTAPAMLDVARWAAEIGIDFIEYHHYVTNPQAKIDAPPPRDVVDRQLEALASWAAASRCETTIYCEGQMIHQGARTEWPRHTSLIKEAFAPPHVMRPAQADHDGAHPTLLCTSPWDTVDIGLNGEIAACCRSSQHNLGDATSPERFAESWFGNTYRTIRASLHRDASGVLTLPACAPCIDFFHPEALSGRRAARQDEQPRCTFHEVPLASITRMERASPVSHAPSPLGLDPSEYVLYEDDLPLHSGPQAWEDVIGSGGGRWCLRGSSVFFTSSDGSDPQTNDRRYRLVRIENGA